ncbi:MAG: glutamine--fructose-6-phosphate transaminase (isomerizing) [Candidatus Puniceispirillaceae bacterium]
MCGIVGQIGDQNAAPILLDALKRLEYRGYDSSGIAAISETGLAVSRAVGKLAELDAKLNGSPLSGHLAIGHTRWATHGGVTEANAHPHMAGDKIAIVHNGIIENYAELRAELSTKGISFASDTDSEVLAHLFDIALSSGLTPEKAIASVLDQIEGAYALAAISTDYPDSMMVARNASPLAIGLGDGESFIASDAAAMAHLTRRIIYLKDGDYAVIRKGEAEIFDLSGAPANREVIITTASPILVDKAGYRHFMEKEIHEQPDAIAHTLSAMTDGEGRLSAALSHEQLSEIKHLTILAAGTSNYAGQIGRYWIERLAGIPCVVEVASEYRYRHPVAVNGGAVLVISQSGESLDTLMAMRHGAEMGLKTYGMVNVDQSTIAREADAVIPTRAGPEIGVASTKAFTAQLTALLSLAVALGRAHGTLEAAEEARIHDLLMRVPGAVGRATGLFDAIRPVAQRLTTARSCLFLGRDMLFPLAMEGALKLKELSYIHAEGFASGEMKHGPIALIEEGLPVVAMLSNDEVSAKSASNLREAEARGGEVILIATKEAAAQVDFASDMVVLDECDPLVAPIILAIPAQILAYLTAVEKGTDVDQPRNLAKSVTVE